MTRRTWASLAFIALLVVLWWFSNPPQDEASAPPVVTPTATATTPTQVPEDVSGFTVADLPPEGRETLDLIASDGPFPYDRDGVTFQNREGLLPDQPRGYWREYTVPTPGEDDRGARRLVVGERGEVYYTSDHYASFDRVVDADLEEAR